MELQLGGFLGLVWDEQGSLCAFRCFFFCPMAFLGFVFICIPWLVSAGEVGFWGLLVPCRVFFGLSEYFSFVSWVSSCLVFALLSISF